MTNETIASCLNVLLLLPFSKILLHEASHNNDWLPSNTCYTQCTLSLGGKFIMLWAVVIVKLLLK